MDVSISASSTTTQTTTQSKYTSKSSTSKGTESTTASASSETTTTQTEVAAVYEKAEDSKDNKGNSGKKGAYTIDKAQVQKMIDESNRQKEAFVAMIQKVLLKQSGTSNIAGTGVEIEFSKDFMTKVAAAADQETINWAKEQVSEDGYYGVKQTSERILNFAKAVTGGDPSKIGEMKDAILKGFAQAEKIWGGKLPDISQQTKDAVMKGLKEWEDGVSAAVE